MSRYPSMSFPSGAFTYNLAAGQYSATSIPTNTGAVVSSAEQSQSEATAMAVAAAVAGYNPNIGALTPPATSTPNSNIAATGTSGSPSFYQQQQQHHHHQLKGGFVDPTSAAMQHLMTMNPSMFAATANNNAIMAAAAAAAAAATTTTTTTTNRQNQQVSNPGASVSGSVSTMAHSTNLSPLMGAGPQSIVDQSVSAAITRRNSSPKASKQTESVAKRVNHNAIERARRESLNGQFQDLASAVPSLIHVRRPSKATIVEKSLEYIRTFKSQQSNNDRYIKTLQLRNLELRDELNRLREKLGIDPITTTKEEKAISRSRSGSSATHMLLPTISERTGGDVQAAKISGKVRQRDEVENEAESDNASDSGSRRTSSATAVEEGSTVLTTPKKAIKCSVTATPGSSPTSIAQRNRLAKQRQLSMPVTPCGSAFSKVSINGGGTVVGHNRVSSAISMFPDSAMTATFSPSLISVNTSTVSFPSLSSCEPSPVDMVSATSTFVPTPQHLTQASYNQLTEALGQHTKSSTSVAGSVSSSPDSHSGQKQQPTSTA
ncbi:hypothetical protein H4219_004348 [Mycoemilia scoparia]|uniref:BHLH domain-containing protein n=1 Tax=Mycoemilia scoparia TaxID=417184 RepID=A0A9W8DRA5_9FUNG|nr:hypothetical protein H4219_004348 [Mycoemilia scoparia]